MAARQYSGVAQTLEAAIKVAHDKIQPTPGKDFTVSKVADWGMQFGGFAQQRRYWVVLVEDPDAPLRGDG